MSVKLLIEYPPVLAKPLASVINQCIKDKIIPQLWKRAYVRIIPKLKDLKSCEQIRPMSITPNLTKFTESLIYRELLTQINPSLDPFQYGCLKGSRPTHYPVRLNFMII